MNTSYSGSGLTMNQMSALNLTELVGALFLSLLHMFLWVTWAEGVNAVVVFFGGIGAIALTYYRVRIAREDLRERLEKRRQNKESNSHLEGLD